MFRIFIPVFKLLEQCLAVVSIEAPFALLQDPVKVVSFYAVESSQMAFGLVPEALDSVDVVFLVGEQLGVVDAQVPELGDIEYVVRAGVSV